MHSESVLVVEDAQAYIVFSRVLLLLHNSCQAFQAVPNCSTAAQVEGVFSSIRSIVSLLLVVF